MKTPEANFIQDHRRALQVILMLASSVLALAYGIFAKSADADSPPAPAALHVTTFPTTTISSISGATPSPPTALISRAMWNCAVTQPAVGQGKNLYDPVDDNGKHYGEGAQNDFLWGGKQILKRDTMGTFCRGFTLEQFLLALNPSGVDPTQKTITPDELVSLKNTWFGNGNPVANSDNGDLATAALAKLCGDHPDLLRGQVIPLDNLQHNSPLGNICPGDIMVLHRPDGTEHCVIFLNWITSFDSQTVVGLVYYSSQKWSTGWDLVSVSGKSDWTANLFDWSKLTLKLPTEDDNYGSGYGPRAGFFSNVTYQPTAPVAPTAAPVGEFVAETSYCFHFTKP